MDKERLEHLKNRFEKQMKKQRYDNSGRKHEFIEIADELLSTVEEQQKEIKRQKELKWMSRSQRDGFMKKSIRYKQALEFYANSHNYYPTGNAPVFYGNEHVDDLPEGPSTIGIDNGEKARQALEKST